MFQSKLVVVKIICLLGASAFSSAQAADFPPGDAVALSGNEASEMLKVASDSQKAAYDSIRTWIGSATMHELLRFKKDAVPDQGPLESGDAKGLPGSEGYSQSLKVKRLNGQFHQEWDIVAKFSVDNPRRLLNSSYDTINPVVITDINTGEVNKIDHAISQWNIGRPDGDYSIRPNELAGELVGFPKSTTQSKPFTKIVVREEVKALSSKLFGMHDFDPRVVFFYGGYRIDELVAIYAEQVKDAKLQKLFKVYQSPDKRYLYIEKSYLVGPSNKTNPHQIVLDAAQSFMPVKSHNTYEGVVLEQTSWSYRAISGVFVPDRYEIVKRNQKNEVTLSHNCKFDTSEINVEIDSQVFELSAFKPTDGDRLIDYVEGKLFVFENNKPIPVAEVMLSRAAAE